jgi:hypothetical protein
VKDFGAEGQNKVKDTKAIQKALNKAKNGEHTLTVHLCYISIILFHHLKAVL